MLVARDARVVAGGEPGGAERLRELEHRVEADLAVAAHARVRGAAGGVAVEEAVHDLGAEALAQVEREVRDAHAMGELARAAHGLRRAAALLAVGAGVGPQLERDRHDLVAGVERELSRGGGVDARRSWRRACGGGLASTRDGPVLRRGAERAVERVGRELGGVALRRASARRARRATSSASERHASRKRPSLDALDDGARRGRECAAAARRRSPPPLRGRPRPAPRCARGRRRVRRRPRRCAGGA